MSSTMASIILRTFSACASSREAKSILLILVTPSTMWAICSPNCALISSVVSGGVFDGIVQQSGGDGGGIQLHLRQQNRDFQGMHEVGLAGCALLSAVMFEGEFVGAADDIKVIVGAVGAGDLQQVAKPRRGQNIRRHLLAKARHD